MAIGMAAILLTCSAFTTVVNPPGDDTSPHYEQPALYMQETEGAAAICFEQYVLCNQIPVVEESTPFNLLDVSVCSHFGLANAGNLSTMTYENQRQWYQLNTASRGVQTCGLQVPGGNMDHRIWAYLWSAPRNDNYESSSHYISQTGPEGGGDLPFDSCVNATHAESVRCPV